ncbi:MAG TPA: hypothetical protein VKE27_02520, partial [Candidatus Dormibacteraeota bacterium]|nr:hypothetical protein [Candidatus Dormibacteraeota bacterium]
MRATLRALSDARWTVVAFAVAAFGLTLLQSVAFFRMAGHTFAERAAFGYSLLLQATASEALYPPPVHPETAAGYLELRALWPLGILLAAWAMVSATKTTTAAIGPRAAAFGVSTSLAAAATCVGVLVGVSSGGESVSGTGLVEAGVLLVALAMACYAICIVIAQITSDPALLATGVMLTLFFVNSLGRVFASLETARWLSPFRYYELSAPLPPGGRFDVGGFVILLAIAAIGITLAFVLSAGRIGHASLVRAATYDPAHATLLNIPVVRNLYPHRLALGAWCIAFA